MGKKKILGERKIALRNEKEEANKQEIEKEGPEEREITEKDKPRMKN